MTFIRKTWTLVRKNLILSFARHWLTALIVAFLAPVIFMFFIAYSKNFFIPPANNGVGSATPLRSLAEALQYTGNATRNKVGFVTNGLGQEVQHIVDDLSPVITGAGFTPVVLNSDEELLTTCPSTVRGSTPCFAAVSFGGVPSLNGSWAYTIRADGAFAEHIYVDRNNNDAQIYILPLQFAVDNAIARTNGTSLANPQNYAYTRKNTEQRNRQITRLYMNSLINVVGVAYFVGLVGVLYQLTGLMATERELGISQLIEVMTARRRDWEAQAMRLLSYHISFDILYLPGWILIGIIVRGINFPASSVGILIAYFILNGFAQSSWAIFCAAFFRKAQLSGISVTLFSVILAIIAQVQTPVTSGAIIVTALIFPPMNFLYFVFYMAYWQKTNQGAELSKPPPHAPWQVPGYVFFIFTVVHLLVYPLLGALVERTLYATTSKARSVQRTGGNAHETVRISGLSKHYTPSWIARTMAKIFRKKAPEQVVAVDDLSMVILKGELSVILGANGAGKSTTMDMLAGLQAPTSGSIEIDGASIGICPQKNVLWNELTCEEHVRIFNSLKSEQTDTRSVIRDLLVACDLKQKLNARSETLSGGQKRKLQLAMMLTGGSNICLLDEVSSGLDPLSRRKIWDILLKERGNRSLLFSTHFLDEADYLSDTITILSKGRLVARGSSVELKQVHGGGYRVKIYNTNKYQEPDSWQDLKKHTYSDHVVYHLPNSSAASDFASELEKLGIREYRVEGPTVEDVFLKLAEEVHMLAAAANASPSSSTASVPPPYTAGSKPEVAASSSPSYPAASPRPSGLKLLPGRRLAWPGQTWVLFRKRFTILKRNVFPYLAAVLIPIIAAALILLFLKGFERLTCSPVDVDQPSMVYSLQEVDYLVNIFPQIPVGPPGVVPSDLLQRIMPDPPGNASDIFQYVNTLDEFNQYIQANFSIAFPGGFFIDPQIGPVFAWVGDYIPAFALITQNILHNAVLKTQINATYQTFDNPFTPSTGDSLQAVLYFGLAMCIFPSFFALYPTQERINRVRALHWSNGVRVLPLWSAYTLFDLVFVVIVSVATSIIYATVADKLYFASYLFLIFLLYGLSSMLLTYILSSWSKSQLGAFAITAGYQLAAFLLYFLAYLLIITFQQAASIDSTVNLVHFVLAVFSPSSNLLRSLLVVYNQFSLICVGQEPDTNGGRITNLGGPILYMIIQSIIYFGIILWIESGWTPNFLRRKVTKAKDVEGTEDVDAEVYREKNRVEDSNDELRVNHVSKQFGDNLAVNDVSFGVPRDEVFALLGPNGAGKSTTFGLIRGDIRPTGRSGDVLINDISIIRNRAAARVHQGVCPQFDAMDSMTVVEHLEFYARARGVRDVQHNVAAVIAAVGLSPYRTRLASKLSGGNKRKLSLGIALVGNPSVLLIDEGSSGMDAAAKRVMWRMLKDVSNGRSMVISTHAMEEADALAGRVGIMAGKMLALGTSDELRQRYGDELNVHVVHKDAPYTSEEDMHRLKDWIAHAFSDATIEDRTFHGQIRFTVPNRRVPQAELTNDRPVDGRQVESNGTIISPNGSRNGQTQSQEGIGALFGQLESARQDLGVAFFAVNQPTLDSVFLAIVGRHNVLEENYKLEHPQKVGAFGRMRRGLLRLVHNA
ncbi:putative ABC transporter [Myriangium duriaei CBS 260.36]|uniref:ABC transporter n=1 Tax=Myriangium duriaei CBS 260.36 TaxID=1168546 RepID=A0A9P4MKH8_9PEZI|nr:putative ABC transporter [Myriangium duriaei CBS 260.36]